MYVINSSAENILIISNFICTFLSVFVQLILSVCYFSIPQNMQFENILDQCMSIIEYIFLLTVDISNIHYLHLHTICQCNEYNAPCINFRFFCPHTTAVHFQNTGNIRRSSM